MFKMNCSNNNNNNNNKSAAAAAAALAALAVVVVPHSQLGHREHHSYRSDSSSTYVGTQPPCRYEYSSGVLLLLFGGDGGRF